MLLLLLHLNFVRLAIYFREFFWFIPVLEEQHLWTDRWLYFVVQI